MLSGFTSWTSPALPRRRKNCTSLANSPGDALISRARRPPHVLWLLKAFENIEQRIIRAVMAIVDFSELHVVESRAVLQKIHNAHGVCVSPAVFHGDFRGNVLQPCVEVDSSFFFQ